MGKAYLASTIVGGILAILFFIITILWMLGFIGYSLILSLVELIVSLVNSVFYMPSLVVAVLLFILIAFNIAAIVMSAINFAGYRPIKVLGFAFGATVLIDLFILYGVMPTVPAPWFHQNGGMQLLLITMACSSIAFLGTGLQFLSVFLSRKQKDEPMEDSPSD